MHQIQLPCHLQGVRLIWKIAKITKKNKCLKASSFLGLIGLSQVMVLSPAKDPLKKRFQEPGTYSKLKIVILFLVSSRTYQNEGFCEFSSKSDQLNRRKCGIFFFLIPCFSLVFPYWKFTKKRLKKFRTTSSYDLKFRPETQWLKGFLWA